MFPEIRMQKISPYFYTYEIEDRKIKNKNKKGFCLVLVYLEVIELH